MKSVHVTGYDKWAEDSVKNQSSELSELGFIVNMLQNLAKSTFSQFNCELEVIL